ncbi:MAG TPA: hypothetical protein VLF64_00375 [Candidatus Saccharimonadales bacterium]|nr:hypothetical protein [Candidatus Saccharimonadales bacterium]
MNGRVTTEKLSFKLILLVIASIILAIMTFAINWRDVGQFWSYTNVAKMILAGIIAYITVFWRTSAQQQYKLFKSVVTLAVPVFAIFATVTLLINPNLAEVLVRESHAFENIEAWFLFTGAIFMFIATVRLMRAGRKLEAVGAAVMALAIFAIAGEEISWGMWLFNEHTNTFFHQLNSQDETNLHNINTFLSEDLYYFGSFVLLVMVPFFKDSIARLLAKFKLERLTSLLPSTWMMLPWTVMAGFLASYSYMQTTILLGFFGSVLVLIHALLSSPSKTRAWMTVGFLALLLIVGFVFTFSWQSVYIDRIRGGSPKEYMEVMTSFGLCVYAVDVYVRLFIHGLDERPLIKRVFTKS